MQLVVLISYVDLLVCETYSITQSKMISSSWTFRSFSAFLGLILFDEPPRKVHSVLCKSTWVLV
jgi:hypothetical protein